jgi:GT2 family glycosyltransferase
MQARPDISVVIPTRGRRDPLSRTVSALATQDLNGLSMEVIAVASDISASEVEAALDGERPFPLRLLEEARPGAAAARNSGISEARAELVLLLGDDTYPATSDLVAGHVRAQREQPGWRRAVLGGCVWAPEIELTAVMDWLDRTGKMLDFGGLDRDRSTTPMLYSGNVSLHREALLRVDGFDERFATYGWEDYDLALRLWDVGVRVAYRPELLVHHLHRYRLEDSLRRMEEMGRTANLLRRLHARRPSLRAPLPIGLRSTLARGLAPLAGAIGGERGTRFLRDPAYRVLHLAALRRGYQADPLPDDPALRGGLRQTANA